MKKTPRERAETLLELHNGNCMAQQVSDVGKAFLQMEVEGLVKVSLAGLPGMLNVVQLIADGESYCSYCAAFGHSTSECDIPQ